MLTQWGNPILTAPKSATFRGKPLFHRCKDSTFILNCEKINTKIFRFFIYADINNIYIHLLNFAKQVPKRYAITLHSQHSRIERQRCYWKNILIMELTSSGRLSHTTITHHGKVVRNGAGTEIVRGRKYHRFLTILKP